MDQHEVVTKTSDYVKTRLSGEGAGHDWWHIWRVWTMAKRIGREESADLFVVELAALLHDISYWKFHGGDESAGPKAAQAWLASLDVDEAAIAHVCEIIAEMSFKGAGTPSVMRTREGMVVQDADRLDALGAIGIARAFAYGGHKEREMHNPALQPVLHASFEEYKKSEGTTINHFYEKLLLLKDRMNTGTGRQIAEGRHAALERYLARFFREWEGKA